MYIFGGSKPEKYITPQFLKNNGAPPGSIYTCNPSAYMTDITWDANVEAYADAIRKMDPVIAANPDWWVEFHVDGFKSKVNTFKGQQVFLSRKIAIIQSPSHTSHVNQGFDKNPGKASKAHQREWLPLIRDSVPAHTSISDNFTLLLAMLASETAVTGDTWRRGYTNVNLNPDTTRGIEVWLSEISPHLIASGEPDRMIQHGYSPTNEEVMMEHGKKHLRSIKIPPLYEMMNETKQSAVMSILSSPDFKWTSEEVRSVSDQFPTLKLLFDSNLSRLWTFLKAMQEAVELGVAETGDLVPD
jgi:hypothetical protein